jgi:hypothetical protein
MREKSVTVSIKSLTNILDLYSVHLPISSIIVAEKKNQAGFRRHVHNVKLLILIDLSRYVSGMEQIVVSVAGWGGGHSFFSRIFQVLWHSKPPVRET